MSVLFALTLGLFYACSDDEKKDAEVFEVTIASVKCFSSILEPLRQVDGVSTRLSPVPMNEFFYAKKEGKSEWEHLLYPEIKGLNYKEGFEYVLRVRKNKTIFAEGTGDYNDSHPFYKLVLLEEISKVEKESENIPMERGNIVIASQISENESTPYYASTMSNGTYWVQCPEIEGFVYEEGYEYLIEVDCKYNGVDANPKYTYIYVSTIEKKKKDSEGLPKLIG